MALLEATGSRKILGRVYQTTQLRAQNGEILVGIQYSLRNIEWFHIRLQ